jgi:hypothetical protein
LTQPCYTPDPRYEALQVLTRARFQLVHVMAQEKNRVLARVFQTFSAYGPGRPFADVFGATSQHVLTELTVSEIASLELPCLAQRVFGSGADAHISSVSALQAQDTTIHNHRLLAQKQLPTILTPRLIGVTVTRRLATARSAKTSA